MNFRRRATGAFSRKADCGPPKLKTLGTIRPRAHSATAAALNEGVRSLLGRREWLAAAVKRGTQRLTQRLDAPEKL